MTFLGIVFRELETPDAQKLNWYGWLTNQCGHFVLGLLITAVSVQFISVYYAILPSFTFSSIKEMRDILRDGSVKDSFVDWWFQGLGSGFCLAFFLHEVTFFNGFTLVFLTSLIMGLVVRVRKVLNSLKRR